MKKEDTSKKSKMKKEMLRDWLILAFLLSLSFILLTLYPANKDAVAKTSWEYLIELMWVLPAVMIIIGLFAVFIPNDVVAKYLGKSSGIKGILISIGIGTLPTGPLYVAFPMAAAMLKKGARISNIIVFLSAWACIKLPQEMVELQLLGLDFMLMRLALTVIFVVIMGILIEKIIEWNDKKKDITTGV